MQPPQARLGERLAFLPRSLSGKTDALHEWAVPWAVVGGLLGDSQGPSARPTGRVYTGELWEVFREVRVDRTSRARGAPGAVGILNFAFGQSAAVGVF